MTALIIKITDAGRGALVNAEANGTLPLTIAKVGITATAFTADDTLTALPGEIKQISTIAGGAVSADTMHVTVRDTTTDTYSLRGIGLWLSDGTLLGSYGQADVILEKSTLATALLAVDVQFADIDATSFTFGDTNFVLNEATTEMLGLVELATDAETVTGTDTERVVVPHALKAALDARLGVGAPTTFLKSLLLAATAAAARVVLGIKGAALYDTGAGNNLDADKLDGKEGAYYAPLNSPGLTGVPTAPTAATATNNLQIATTAFVVAKINALINGSPGALDTLKELADAMGDDPNFAATITNALALKAPLASPGLTGVPTAPTAATATSNLQLANTAFVHAVVADALTAYLPKANPTFTGIMTGPAYNET